MASARERVSGDEVTRRARARGLALGEHLTARLAAHVRGCPSALDDVLDDLVGLSAAELVALRAPDVDLPAGRAARVSVRTRMEGLGDEARRLVETAAVAVGRQRLSVLAEACGVLDPLGALDEAVAAGLLTARRGGADVVVGLRHAVERAGVRSGMTQARLAEIDEVLSRVVDDEVVAATHRVRARVGPDPGLADEVELLARTAAGEGRWRDAGWCWLNATRVSPAGSRPDRLVRATDAFVGAGDLALAGALLAELPPGEGGPAGDAVRGYRAALVGHRAEAEHLLRDALAAVTASGPGEEPSPDVTALTAELRHRLALHSLLDWDGPAVVEHASAAARTTDVPAAREARTLLGLGLAVSGAAEDGRDLSGTVRAELEGGELGQRAALAAGWVALAHDDVLEAARHLQFAAPAGAWPGSTRIALWSHAWLARVQIRLGRLVAALDTVEAGLALVETTGQRVVEPLLRWSGAEASALTGDEDAARAHAGSAVAEPGGYPVMRLPSILARAVVAQMSGDAHEVALVMAPLVALDEGPTGERLREPGFWPWQDVYGQALAALGRPAEALAVVDRHEPVALARGHRSSLARFGGVRARALAADGDVEAAHRLFEDSVRRLDPGEDPLLVARLRLAQGQVLRRAGQRSDAEVVLAEARSAFESMGAQAYVERCEEELRAGVRSGRTGRDTAPVLTDHETRVAELVASGLSNKEVAARLFVTPKTVQYHLTRIYARLGVRSRSELAARWRETDEV